MDASLRKHRTSATQTVIDILTTLKIEHWETEFPSIDLGLRESIRLNMVGSVYRLNISGRDVPIAETGEIVPRDAYLMYQMDDLHMDPAVYTDPAEFDPGRYLPDREEDRKTSPGYLGWGAGRHPCLGIRFAMEMSIIVAMFSALFDWESPDSQGAVLTEPPALDRDLIVPAKPAHPVMVRYTLRRHSN